MKKIVITKKKKKRTKPIVRRTRRTTSISVKQIVPLLNLYNRTSRVLFSKLRCMQYYQSVFGEVILEQTARITTGDQLSSNPPRILRTRKIKKE